MWFAVQKAPIKTATSFEDGVVWMLCAELKDYTDLDSSKGPFDDAGRTLLFRPRAVTRRIVAQSAIFTVHRLSEKGDFVPLEKNRLYKDKLTKFVVLHAKFPSMRNELFTMGVSAASLFPDLDGLCRHLTWRYFKLEDETSGLAVR